MTANQKTFAYALERAIAHSSLEVLNGETQLYSLVSDFLGNSPQGKQSLNLLRNAIDCGIPARMYGAASKDAATQNITVATCRKLLIDSYGFGEEAAGRFMGEFAAALGWKVAAVPTAPKEPPQQVAPMNQAVGAAAGSVRVNHAQPRHSVVLIFVIDTSGSMDGSKMNAVNTALKELMAELPAMGTADTEIKVAILTFSFDCRWLTPAPVKPSEFPSKPIEADGITNLGTACAELDKRMSRHDLLASSSTPLAPVLVLLTDGEPTNDYMTELQKLRRNEWYVAASKFAIPIGVCTDPESMAAFTGDKKTVLKPALCPADLIQKIKAVAIDGLDYAIKHHQKSACEVIKSVTAKLKPINNAMIEEFDW